MCLEPGAARGEGGSETSAALQKMACQYLQSLSAYVYRIDTGPCFSCTTQPGERWKDGTLVEKWDPTMCGCERCLHVIPGADHELLEGAPSRLTGGEGRGGGGGCPGESERATLPPARAGQDGTERALILSLATSRIKTDTETWTMWWGETASEEIDW